MNSGVYVSLKRGKQVRPCEQRSFTIYTRARRRDRLIVLEGTGRGDAAAAAVAFLPTPSASSHKSMVSYFFDGSSKITIGTDSYQQRGRCAAPV